MGTLCSGTPEMAEEMEKNYRRTMKQSADLVEKHGEKPTKHLGKDMFSLGPQTKEQALDTVRHEADLRKGEWYQSRTKPFI
jgi:hypothetical protein